MIYGINCHQSGPEGLRLAASLGAEFIRVDGNWYDLEPTRGHYTWGWLDDLIATATALGLKVYPTIGYSPKWIGERNTPPPVAEWKLLLREFGQRYKGKVQYIGLWNEPNIQGLYAGTVERYIADILQAGAEVLRSIPDADYKICGPDLSTSGTWRPWLKTLLEQGHEWLDLVTTHCYGSPGRKARDKLMEVRQVMDWAGAMDLNVAVTEVGWNTAKISEALQAKYLDQFLEAARNIPWLLAILHFNLVNESEETQWGLFRSDGTPKESANIFKEYTQQSVV